jgi:hypothetical protein
MLEEIVGALVEAAEPMRKRSLAVALGLTPEDRTFERALEVGIERGRLERPKRGTYALGGGEDD